MLARCIFLQWENSRISKCCSCYASASMRLTSFQTMCWARVLFRKLGFGLHELACALRWGLLKNEGLRKDLRKSSGSPGFLYSAMGTYISCVMGIAKRCILWRSDVFFRCAEKREMELHSEQSHPSALTHTRCWENLGSVVSSVLWSCATYRGAHTDRDGQMDEWMDGWKDKKVD